MKKILILYFFLLIGFISALAAHNWDNPFTRSTEFLIDTNIVYLPPSGRTPSVSCDGTNYFVVWVDESRTNNYDILGSRVTQSGEVIDTAGILISYSPSNQLTPSVANNGTHYLVVWSDLRSNNTYDIYGVRVDTSGIVLDSVDILIASSASYDLLTPAVTYGGQYYFVIWKEQHSPTTGYICGARVDTLGNLIDTSSIVINSLPLSYISPAISFDGKNYLAVWTVATLAYAARIDTGGRVIDTTNIQIATNPGTKMFPSLAFDGRKYLIVWQDNRNSSYDIYGVRIDTSGIVIDTSAFGIVTMGNDLEYPKITFNGKHYFLVWEDYRAGNSDIYSARVDTSGLLIDTTNIPISTYSRDEYNPSIVFDGTHYLIAWSECDSGIYCSRMDTSGTLLDTLSVNISTPVCPQWFPSCTFGRNFLVVWQDIRNGVDYNIYGARVDTMGTILDPDCILISTAAVNQQFPKVAYSGSNYLVVWQDRRFSNIYGARVDTSGVVLEPSGFTISGAIWEQESPSVIFGTENYFVVWHDWRNVANSGIYGTRVTTSGVVLNPLGIQISYMDGYEELHPSLSFNGRNYLVVWYRNFGLLYGAFVDTSGQVLDSLAISKTIDHESHASIASDGSGYFVVWQDSRNPSFDIYGARVDSSGIVLDTAGIPVSTAEGDQVYPSVAFDGTDYIILWEDYRNVFSDIHGARVSTEGVVLDTFTVTLQEGNQFSPTLAKGPGDDFLVTYSGFVDSINARPANTIRIWGNLFIPPVGVKEDKPISKSLLFSLKQNFPNPVNSKTTIRFQIPEITKVENLPVSLRIYDLSGRLIKVFSLFTPHSSLITTVTWDCRDGKGKQVPNGIYFYRLTAGEKTAVRKMVVIR